MKIAVISDIQANLPALEAVYEDMVAQGSEKVICCGDIVGYGPCPNEVIKFLRGKHICSIMGNYDETVAFNFPDCGCLYCCPEEEELNARFLAWTKVHTSEESRIWLSELPDELRLTAAEWELLFVHGSPSAIAEYLPEDAPADVFDVHALTAEADVVVCGHTHIPYVKRVRDVLFVNVGSVGKPKDGEPKACYALLELSVNEVKVDFRRVEYDLTRIEQQILATDLPRELLTMLKKGGLLYPCPLKA